MSAELQVAFDALRRDLLHVDGPRISTMRNYRFAIVPYPPAQEFALRAHVQRLSAELVAHGWRVVSIDLHQLLLARVRALGQEQLDWLIQREQRLARYGDDRALNTVRDALAPLVEGPDGIAADCAQLIADHVGPAEPGGESADSSADPDRTGGLRAADRTVALIGRAGALYPFFRSSALLRHLDGRTGNVPVVLLYPGLRRGPTGLSFMGELSPDNDYRPRIYP